MAAHTRLIDDINTVPYLGLKP